MLFEQCCIHWAKCFSLYSIQLNTLDKEETVSRMLLCSTVYANLHLSAAEKKSSSRLITLTFYGPFSLPLHLS